MGDVGDLAAHLDRERDLADQVPGMHADDAAADDALRALVEDQLGEALGAADADRAAARRPRELADADLEAPGLRLGLGDADPGDLRVGVGDRRDHPRDPFLVVPGGDFGREPALVRGLVGEHRVTDQVADREDMRHVAAHLPVDRNEAALADTDAGVFGTELAAVGRAADRDQHAIEQLRLGRLALGRGGLERHLEPLLLRLDHGGLDLQVHGDALLLQAVGEWLDEVGIGARHQLVHELDHGHLAAERAVHRRHLQADDAAADDEQSAGNIGEFERVGRIHQARIVPGEAGQFHRLRAGGDDALLERDQLRAVDAVDLDLVQRHEPADAGDHAHLALLGHAGQALGQLADHLVLVRAQRIEGDLRLAERDPVVARVGGFVDHRGRVQQRLRRDAADIEADAAELRITLDQYRVETEIGGAERGGVAAGTGADHEQAAGDIGLAAGGVRGRGCRAAARACGGGVARNRQCCLRLRTPAHSRALRVLGRRRHWARIVLRRVLGTLLGRLRRCAAFAFGFQHRDHRALGDAVAELDLQLRDHPRRRRRHFHRRLVRFQRDEPLVLDHRVADRDQQLDHRDTGVITDVGHFHFDRRHSKFSF